MKRLSHFHKRFASLLGVAFLAIVSIKCSTAADRMARSPADFKAPDYPSLTILDQAPTAIDSPTSGKAFATSLLTASQADTPSFAIETAPYWWASHPEAELNRDYLAGKVHPLTEIKESFSLSVSAITNTESVNGTDVKRTSYGVGLRFNVKTGRVYDVDSANKAIENLRAALASDKIASVPTLIDEYRAIGARDHGLRISVASALRIDSTPADVADLDTSRFGAWITLAYSPTKEGGVDFLRDFTALATVRHLTDETGGERTSHTDYGFKMSWANPNKNVPLRISAEYVSRSGFDDSNDERYAFMAEYSVNEQLSVYATFGNAFDKSSSAHSSSLALLGVNFAIGGKVLPNLAGD